MGQADGNNGDKDLYRILESVQYSNLSSRTKKLKDLQVIFDKANLAPLNDKTYHKIYEVLFKLILEEKANYLVAQGEKKTTAALSRLTTCADTVRLVIKKGIPTLKARTVEAILDHILQTLPTTIGDFFEPLSQHYLKSLCAVLEHQVSVERLPASVWKEVATFCLQAVDRYIDENDGEPTGLSHSFSGLGTSRSIVRTSSGNGARAGNVSKQNADDVLLSLLCLVSAPNAPLHELTDKLATIVVRFLAVSSTAHQSAFSILNIVLVFCREDRSDLLQSIAQGMIPIICRFWQGKTLAKDVAQNNVRDEILILLLTIQLHLERVVMDDATGKLSSDLEALLDVMRAEYVKRSDRDRLQLEDLDMADLGSTFQDTTPFRLLTFRLRQNNINAERHWANLQLIGVLERLVSLGNRKQTSDANISDNEVDKHPRKRQRTSQPSYRLLSPISSDDEGMRLSGLQVLPFVLQDFQLTGTVLSEVLGQLSICTSDKRGHIASWALLAIASCVYQKASSQEATIEWTKLWHVGARSLTFSATCRAAAVVLHALLSTRLVLYREVGEDIGSIITAADIRGPVVLCDSAVFLMTHLLHVRVTEVPGASLTSCNHVIRWLFARWNPSDKSFASLFTSHLQPYCLTDLLRTALGLPRERTPTSRFVTGGAIAQALEQQMKSESVVRYLLLLEDLAPVEPSYYCRFCPQHTEGGKDAFVLNSLHFHTARKLILELLSPKISDLLQSLVDRYSAPATDTFRRAIYACMTVLLLMPHFADSNSPQFQSLETDSGSLILEIIKVLRGSSARENRPLMETLYQAIEPYIPACDSLQFALLSEKAPHLLNFFDEVSRTCDASRRDDSDSLSLDHDGDMMDIDDDIRQSSQSKAEEMPRRDLALAMSPGSFITVVRERLRLVLAMSHPSHPSGFIPSVFVDNLLAMPIQELMSCRQLLREIFDSSLIVEEADANRLVLHVGDILGSAGEWRRCEVMHGLCLDILIASLEIWFKDSHSGFTQLYEWFFEICVTQRFASPNVLKGFSRLLLLLIRSDPNNDGLPGIQSARTSLLSILHTGHGSVLFYIGKELPEIFKSYVLKDHDSVFVDVLQSLPADPDKPEGIAFRLFALAQLASKWTTLLRRCIYHIFETPANIPDSSKYATRCLANISSGLEVEGPRELFSLFAPQLLYTWLENNDIREIPYEIFGFASLKALVVTSQQVAAGLMVMRGQHEEVTHLAELLEHTDIDVLKSCFANVMAYSIGYTISVAPTPNGEAWVKKRLGKELFWECVNLYFSDILALLFNTIDNGDMEKYLLKNESLSYAGKNLKDIRTMNASTMALPPNQQPMYKAKHLIHAIQHLCSKVEHELSELYTPALVTSIARSLLNTLHPALGSLHACSVIRKIRVLISLSASVALKGYPLEMLLQSLCSFITDTECADDCFGMIQYLLTRGTKHLLQVPSFFAGIALSILGSLKILIESDKASTTQESQHQETMSKARGFLTFMTNHVTQYPASTKHSRAMFQAIIHCAHSTGTIGNADAGTSESHLLTRLLEDEKASGSLLSQPLRESAVSRLCSNFQVPASFRSDIFGDDKLAISNAAVVWKSCRGNSVSKQYLSWAGRVLGRAFAASGTIHHELLQESGLSQIQLLSSSTHEDSSAVCVLRLLQSLTLGQDQRTVGLAESALRSIVTTVVADSPSLTAVCQNALSESLCEASVWLPYQMPPSETQIDRDDIGNITDPFTADAILRPHWLRDFAIVLSRFVPNNPILRALAPILHGVPGFASTSFPFILHLVLSTPSQAQTHAKKRTSDSFVAWFRTSEAVDRNNLKMLIDSILYLRTQPMASEKSSADRSTWLEIDYSKAAVAATQCGMFKTALLFVEEHCFQVPAKSSRRSSAITQDVTELPKEVLLNIFQNIDDPDLYYGVQQNASLSTILARLEYEGDGPKSLAFRGAQYDSHVRRKDKKSANDAQSLVKALDMLSLSGLSYSLLQAQQEVGMSQASLESMFNTARKLEQWDIPVPSTANDNSVTIYKAFQAVHKSPDNITIQRAINEGFECIMSNLIREELSANALHSSLRTLAALIEVDEVLSTRGSEQFEEVLSRFRGRSEWMRTGRFDDIGYILSCRGTILSSLSDQPRLQKMVDLVPIDARLVEVHSMLLSSQLSRSHNALQESLSLATSLIDLIIPCQKLGLNLEAAIHLEAANALWDQGEMAASIGMLQTLDKNTSFKKETVAVGRSDLLSKIGYQVSVARLEKPDQILENYLKPALKELRGKVDGSEAGHVFHQFAVFCDQQLEDADGLEDLKRLEQLSKNKKSDVEWLSNMYATASSTSDKNKYRGHLSKNKTWLKLDEEELQRHISSRDEFLRQSLENYLLALTASDDHDSNALRFSALWLQHSEKEMANEAVSKHLFKVPSRKFAGLMNQLTSRLQDTHTNFQQLLFRLVVNICTDHPFHGMYQIYAAANSHANQNDNSALFRQKATNNVAKHLASMQSTKHAWTSISLTNKVYCQLAAEKDEQRYKANKKVNLKDSIAGMRLNNMLPKYPIPSPTMPIKLAANRDYSNVPVMVKFDAVMAIASGVSTPKVITAISDNGTRYKQLVKGGNDDLRQDAIMEQVFEQVSELLRANQSTRQRNLSIRTYKVLPLTSIAGVIEFVDNTTPLHEYLMPAHERYYPKDLKGNQCRKEIGDVQSQSVAERIKRYRSVTDRFHPVMRYFFTEKFSDPDEWFVRRLAYTRSTAAISILGHVLGLGDRHGHNILLDAKSGEVVHIDLGVAFEMGRVLPVPELVPFRLTRDIVDGMGITKTEGVFRRCCEFTLEALRKEAHNIMTILDVLRYDPLYSWSISPVRLAKLQEGQSAAHEPDDGPVSKRDKEKANANEPGEADRALTVVNKKLSKTLSVTATVNDLINQASDEKNLAVLYSGWAAYA